MKPPDRAAALAWLRSPLGLVLLGVVALLVAVRIALPYVLRPIIVERADKAMVGRIALADLDLSLIRGGVTLRGLEVYPEELPPPPALPEPKKPLFSAGRLWTQISWLQLVMKTIDVEEFELDDFAVRLDRIRDGLILPKPAPSSESEPSAPESEAKEDSGWAFAADSLVLQRGSITFRDYTVGGGAPQRFDLAIPSLAARKLALSFDPSGTEPGHVEVVAEVGGGTIGFEADVETKQAGPAAHAKITLAHLPIGGVRVYLKMFGWTDLQGYLDAAIEHRFETAGAHEVSGTLSLSSVSATVPELDRPAMSFDKLTVTLDKVDVVKQHAAVADVTLAGAHLVVNPKLPRLMVVLTAPDKPAEPEPAPAEPDEPTEPQRPWTWSLARARVEKMQLEALPASELLVLGVDAEVQKLASPETGTSPVSLTVTQNEGLLQLTGAFGLEPTRFEGKLVMRDFALPPLASRAPATPGGELLLGGKARSDLAIALTPRAGGAPGTADLRVAGSLGLAGVAVGKAGDKDFSAGWKDFELQIREIAVAPALGGDPAQPRAIDVGLELVRVVEPDVRVTRTENGIALPPIDEAKPATAPEPEKAPPATAAAPPRIRAKIAKLRVERGRARISDRSVKPFYEGRIEKLDVRARGVRYPGPEIDSVDVELVGLQGAKLKARGSVLARGSKVDATLDGLLLAPFNPYVTPTGYSLADGALSFKLDAKLEGEKWDTTTNLKLDDLDVGGSEGEALFEKSFGIPLSMALGLLKDTEGAITLAVPVGGDREGARVGLGSIAGQAVRKALAGALAAPLKLLGVGTKDGKVASLRPTPIEFLPGSSELADSGAARVEQLGSLLSASPGISLTLHGSISADDERALRERALLAELERTSGFRALGSLGEIGVRREVRGYLQKRAAGETAELDPEASKWLEAKLATIPLDPGALDGLAQSRAAALQQAIVGQHGIGAERVAIGAPVTGGAASVPGVTIDIGARSAGAS